MSVAVAGGGLVLAAAAGRKGWRRLALSRAKHGSLAGHVRMAKRVAGWIPYFEHDEAATAGWDGATAEVVARRRAGFRRLAAALQAPRRTLTVSREAAEGLSDLQFTRAYRVPFQFSALVRQHLPAGSFAAESSGVMLTDLDGNRFYDLTGSYGVNLLGNDFYKTCIAAGAERVRGFGAVLGTLHPVVADNVARLRALSGLDEVSFHMSGTEAVMQAVRLARYHTRRTHIVRFAGAYHGWWGDVQPGVGNPVAADRTYTLAELSCHTLHVLRTRRDIACVLVNPLQALHPNMAAPADSALVNSRRRAGFDRAGYAAWLRELRAVCTARGIVLIFDEVFVGFRLAPEGARRYFGVQPDMVTWGKTLGGGLPVGALCGRNAVMRRFRDDRPGDICLARGTFNAHPHVMGAMAEFLQHLDSPAVQSLYQGLDETWDRRANTLNAALANEGLPVQVANLQTIWTVTYTTPSAYNWLLQYYLRAEGLALSWVGTGRLIFSLDYTEADFAAVSARFVQACRAMAADGWWSSPPGTTDRSIGRRVLRDVLRAVLRGGLRPAAGRHRLDSVTSRS